MIESKTCSNDDIKTSKDSKSEVKIVEITDEKDNIDKEKSGYEQNEKEGDKKLEKSKPVIEGNV